MPRVFYVNWFRKDDQGKFMWPGYGENSRVLKWVFERCDNKADAVDTPIGLLPTPESLDTKGLDIKPETLKKLLEVDTKAWRGEIESIRQHFAQFGNKLPKGLKDELDGLEKRLKGCDLVITGEGRMDWQTAFGKTPAGVARVAKKLGLDEDDLTELGYE